MTVRLKPGDEPVEVSGQRLLLGLSTPGPVPPGMTADIVVTPQLSGLITAWLLDKNTAEAFDLEDFRIGKNSQLVTADPISLAAYAAAPAEGSSWPDMREIQIAEDRFREIVDLDRCLVGLNVIFRVKNVSGVPLRFRGAFVFLAYDGNH